MLMVDSEFPFKVRKCRYIEKDEGEGDTMITLRIDNPYKGKMQYKDYTLFLKGRKEMFNEGDLIFITKIHGVDRSTFKTPRNLLFTNVNLFVDVELAKENMSATKRDVEDAMEELPF